MNESGAVRIRTNLKIHSGLPDFTPFLCVFFLLLIFFMLGSSFVQVSGIAVDLPQAQVRTSFSTKKIVATVSADNRIYFNDVEITEIDSFKNKLMETVNASRDRVTMLLRADSGADFGTVARIMAVAEDLKVNIILPTAPAAGHAPRAFGKTE